MLGPRGVTRARQLRPLRLWPRRPWGDGTIMASMQVRGVCSIWAGSVAAGRMRAFPPGVCLGLWGTRAGSRAAPETGPSHLQGVGEGGEAARRGGWSRSVEADTSRPGSWGIKKAKGEEGAKFDVGSAALVSNHLRLTRTTIACLPPGPGMPFPPRSPAGRKQLLSPLSPGQGRPREGLSVGSRKGVPGEGGCSQRRFAASTQASHARPPWLLGPSTLLLTLSPMPQGYLPLSAFSLSTHRGPAAHFLTR